MCGIVGLHLKNAGLESRLGELVVPMLDMLASRGPDSTGVAVYSHDVSPGEAKYSLCAPEEDYNWGGYAARLEEDLGSPVAVRRRGRDAVVVSSAAPDSVLSAVGRVDKRVRLFGHGSAIEVYKDVGPAIEVCARYGISAMAGYQAIGHTRMATESAVTIEHSHPFAAGSDLALVHNGSFSNHATIRRELRDHGVTFDTDNDSEVAARFIGACLERGDDLEKALRRVCETFDGFYTLLATTPTEFAVVRDAIACKPALIAEGPGWVAMASEYRALSGLPGIAEARVFEPAPEEVYLWSV